MRDAIDIQVEELIIHIMEPQGQGLILSQIAIPLGDNPLLLEYFNHHIQSTLQESASKAARFRNINPGQPSGFCDGLLSGRLSLVYGSQRLAEELYRILERDRRISTADLGICFFSAGNYHGRRFLAILKIDPSQVFQHVIRNDAHGNTYVSFESESKAFTNERLQKSAFIHTLDPRHPDYDMLLLDRQARGAEDGRIAKFFSETFLDAEEAFDPREYTERLYKRLLSAQNSIRPLISPDQYEELEVRIRNAITAPRINIDSWLDELPLSDEIKHQIDRTIREDIPDREFDLDQGFSEKLIQKIRFRGDYNLKVEILAQHQGQVIKSVRRITNDPERPPFHRIIIETEEWKKVSR